MTDSRSSSEPGADDARALIAGVLARKGRPLAVVVLALLGALRLWDPWPVEGFRLAAFDLLQSLQAGDPDKPFVVVVAIDDDSLARYGQWPWPRTLLARLADRIAADGPVAVGFDMLFPEPDRLSPDSIALQRPELGAEAIALLRGLPTNDAVFAKALVAMPTILGVAGASTTAGDFDLPQRGTFATRGDPGAFVRDYPGLIANVEPLNAAAQGFGLLSVAPELDGVVRRLPLVAKAGGELRPSLAVEMMRIASGTPAVLFDADGLGVRQVAVAGIAVPTSGDGRVWLRHLRHAPSRFIPAHDILGGRVPEGAFAGRMVIVAATAVGLGDYVTTPVEPRMPGAEVHAQLIEAIIGGDVLIRPLEAPLLEGFVAVLLAAILMIWVPSARAEVAFIGLLVGLGALAAGSWYAFRIHDVLLDPTLPGTAAVLTYAIVLGGSLAAADAARRVLRLALDREKLAAQRMEGELAAARDIQMGILPSTFPAFPGRADIDVHALIEPARAVGGDFYDYALVDDHRLFFMIGDVSGKGVPAALFMALSKVLAKSAALRQPEDIGEALTRANREIVRENAADMFVTVFAGVLDLASGDLQFVTAGHDAPFLVSPGAEPSRLDGIGGPPLCVVEDQLYPTDRARLQRGDALVLVTDGVTEALDASGAHFSARAVWRVLSVMPPGTGARDIAEALRDAVNDFVGGAEPADDVTILVVRWL